MRQSPRPLIDAIAIALSMNPRQSTLVILIAVAVVVSLNWLANVSEEIVRNLLPGGWAIWILLISFPILALLLRYVVFPRPGTPDPVQTSLPLKKPAVPPGHKGLIVSLSTFTSYTNLLPADTPKESWNSDRLLQEFSKEQPNWTLILNHVHASNMQVPLTAIQHHARAGTLQHVWVIVTDDMQDPDDARKITRPGSKHLALAFKEIVSQLGIKAQIHIGSPHFPELVVSPYNSEQTFAAVSYIFNEFVPRLKLAETDVISDITSGTVLMSTGNVLACALFSRHMQFTAATNEPISGAPLDAPTCYTLAIDDDQLRRLVLKRIFSEEPAAGT